MIQTEIVFQKLLLDMVEEKSDGDMERAIEWLWVGGYVKKKLYERLLVNVEK